MTADVLQVTVAGKRQEALGICSFELASTDGTPLLVLDLQIPGSRTHLPMGRLQ